ncbi:hypothetical protein QYM36_013234, partial [Artemia franciscana]
MGFSDYEDSLEDLDPLPNLNHGYLTSRSDKILDATPSSETIGRARIKCTHGYSPKGPDRPRPQVISVYVKEFMRRLPLSHFEEFDKANPVTNRGYVELLREVRTRQVRREFHFESLPGHERHPVSEVACYYCQEMGHVLRFRPLRLNGFPANPTDQVKELGHRQIEAERVTRNPSNSPPKVQNPGHC